MKSTGINFTGHSVRAILAGAKTQTRRIVRDFTHDPGCARLLGFSDDGVATFGHSIPDDPMPLEVKCPYGTIGDRLWGREASTRSGAMLQYVADHRTTSHLWPVKWTRDPQAPQYLPRACSRLELELTAVRVRRVQQISADDARAEGVAFERRPALVGRAHTVLAYRDAWEDIHGAGAWERNDWVWALTFKLVTP